MHNQTIQTTDKNVLHLIIHHLSAKDLISFGQCCSLFHNLSLDDRHWEQHCLKDFGEISPNDINIKGTLFKVNGFRAAYMIFKHYYNSSIKYLKVRANNYFDPERDITYNRFYHRIDSPHCAAKGFLFRRSDSTMTIPSYAFNFGHIKPRRGDMIVDLDDYGYRNDGFTFWNGEIRIRMDHRSGDDYGQTPHEFSFPEFPIGYFYNGHNETSNILLDGETLQNITNNIGILDVYGHVVAFDEIRIIIEKAKRENRKIPVLGWVDTMAECSGVFDRYCHSEEYVLEPRSDEEE